jgi:molybdopterin converting factor small subunit
MKIIIDLMTPYSEIIETPIELNIEEGNTLDTAIKALRKKHPVMDKSFTSDIDRPTITINDRIVYDMDEALAEGDRIIIFFPVGGG